MLLIVLVAAFLPILLYVIEVLCCRKIQGYSQSVCECISTYLCCCFCINKNEEPLEDFDEL
jgi:hypothetical protein